MNNSSFIHPLIASIAPLSVGGLTKEQLNSIRKYILNTNEKSEEHKFYKRLNSYLRTGEVSKDEQTLFNIHANRLSNAIKKFKLDNDVLCYRGVDNDVYKGCELGKVFTDKSFVSTSINTSTLKNHKYWCIIVVRKGSRGAFLGTDGVSHFPKQREFLLDKDNKFRVIGRENNITYLEVM